MFTVTEIFITQRLADQTVSLGAQVTFQVTLSQGGVTGEWFKDGVKITSESRYQSYQTGNSIYLLFTNSQVSDSGRYTFTVNGQSTSAQLTVTGKLCATYIFKRCLHKTDAHNGNR